MISRTKLWCCGVLKLLIIFLLYNLAPVVCLGKHVSNSRFISTKRSNISARTGPGHVYPVKYVYAKRNMPLLIIDRHENWIMVEDIDGDSSWINSAVVSRIQYTIVISKHPVKSYKNQDINSKVIMIAEPNVILRLHRCQDSWCQVSYDKKKSWIEKHNLWNKT